MKLEVSINQEYKKNPRASFSGLLIKVLSTLMSL